MTPKDAARRAVIAAAQVQRLVDKKKVTLAPVTIWLKIVREREKETAE
jgi:hypothetical protein